MVIHNWDYKYAPYLKGLDTNIKIITILNDKFLHIESIDWLVQKYEQKEVKNPQK
jgi:hypothetical protein